MRFLRILLMRQGQKPMTSLALIYYPAKEKKKRSKTSLLYYYNLQCRRILGGRKLVVYIRIVETAIFDVITKKLGRVKIATLRVGARHSPPPTPLLLTNPIFSSLFEFQHIYGASASKTFARPKKTPALQAM